MSRTLIDGRWTDVDDPASLLTEGRSLKDCNGAIIEHGPIDADLAPFELLGFAPIEPLVEAIAEPEPAAAPRKRSATTKAEPEPDIEGDPEG